MKTFTRSLAILSITSAAFIGHAVTLDFEGLAGTQGQVVTFYEPVVMTNGFKLAASYEYGPTEFNSLLPGDPASNYTGSTALETSGGTIDLTRADGGAFNLTSLDVANSGKQKEWNHPTTTIDFVGTKADGSVVSRSFTTDTTDALQTVTFDGFTDLVSVSWNEGYTYSNNHQFDNVNVQAVPEPSSLAVLGLGSFGILRRLRRARR